LDSFFNSQLYFVSNNQFHYRRNSLTKILVMIDATYLRLNARCQSLPGLILTSFLRSCFMLNIH